MKLSVKPTLRNDWSKAYKFISVQAIALAMALQEVWPLIPEDMRSRLPEGFVKWLTIGLLAISVYGVMIKQKSLNKDSDEPNTN